MGDCEATRDDAQWAMEEDTYDDLLEAMAATVTTIVNGDVEVIPALWDMVQGGQLPELTGCTHHFFWGQSHMGRVAMYEQDVHSGNMGWNE